MKEQILKMIAANTDFDFGLNSIIVDNNKLAEDIETHFMKFMMWLFSEPIKYSIQYGSNKPLGTAVEDFTIQQVYEYWITLPENKI